LKDQAAKIDDKKKTPSQLIFLMKMACFHISMLLVIQAYIIEFLMLFGDFSAKD